ncbi:cellulose binding domain-containing protein [Umezawaea sp. Da 62-37]|uniref:cellulose binding domain-containing protein n=1 Tax=Umezawaea sp. Da 62-37 TaxID=3075927 RepID=UPI0028F6C6C0|nr:cellulose binding domain-containing protein [Umezawaea sp. Da 62-37]WNV87359.1 cellulose binding domain-containing protein [Umezawaea sp. Da 62-37]
MGLLLTAVGVLLGSGFGAIAAPAGAGPTATTSPPTVMSTPLKFTCRVTDQVNAWDSGLTSQITVTYTGVAPVKGWSLVFALPSGQTITSGWNAVYSPASGQVTATNAPYNADVDTGGSVSIGFQATHTGDTGAPAYFLLNGSSCMMD